MVRASCILPEEALTVVPLEGSSVGPVLSVVWRDDELPVERVVGPAVVEVLVEPAAHLKTAFWSDRDIALVEEAMNVGTQKKSVRDPVLASFRAGSDVGCLECWEGVFPRDGAGSAGSWLEAEPPGYGNLACAGVSRFYGRLDQRRLIMHRRGFDSVYWLITRGISLILPPERAHTAGRDTRGSAAGTCCSGTECAGCGGPGGRSGAWGRLLRPGCLAGPGRCSPG